MNSKRKWVIKQKAKKENQVEDGGVEEKEEEEVYRAV
jgi:hypothetical protein